MGKTHMMQVHLDVGSAADDEFVIESNLPPPVGDFRDPTRPYSSTMAYATQGRLAQAARFFGVVEVRVLPSIRTRVLTRIAAPGGEQDPTVHYSYFGRREYEQANAPAGNWAVNTVRQITGTLRGTPADSHWRIVLIFIRFFVRGQCGL